MNFALEIIIAPILTMIAVQTIKLATDGIKGNLNFKNILTTYGGMPSSHSAFVAALTTMVAYKEGVDTVAFSISVVFSLLVITDAMQLRKHIDQQGQAISKIISRLTTDEQKSLPQFKAKIEHTLPQILVGALLGFIIASLVNLVF